MNDDHGTLVEPGTIRFVRSLPGPVERVWAYLVESDRRRRWLAQGEMDLRVGGRVELAFRNAELSRDDDPAPEKYRDYENSGRTQGKVTRCEPPRVLAFTWDEGGAADASEVTFELEPRGDAVLLTLTHRRLPAGELLGVAGGWHTHLGMLDDVLAGREPRGFWRTHARVEAEYAARGF